LHRRHASIFIEILVSVVIFVVVMIPLVSGFQTGVRQTKVVRSRASARYVSEWALAQGRALIQGGALETLACSDPLFGVSNLTTDAQTLFPDTTAPLFDLALTRSVVCLDFGSLGTSDPRLYQIDVQVQWRDPGQPVTKTLHIQSIEGEDI
jgi:hypothetical protein